MELNGVDFRYRRKAPWVLRDVTVALPPGRLVEVTGHNGAEKSTLLRLLAGIVRPAGGTVTGRPDAVGYAPERFPADQPFTARAYLGHMARMRGGAEVMPWVERLGFAGLLDTRLPDLSKGSAHKVGLIQALMCRPGLLILDEPFAGLDAVTRAALPAILRQLARDGTTIVVSDHQGDLRDLPGVQHWHVAERKVIEGVPPVPHRVVEVVVPATEADALIARLTAEGYEAR